MLSISKLKRGDRIEFSWIDACFYSDLHELNETALKAGGELLWMTGYFVEASPKAILVCAELDDKRMPHRDFNLIPRSLIRSLKRSPK